MRLLAVRNRYARNCPGSSIGGGVRSSRRYASCTMSSARVALPITRATYARSGAAVRRYNTSKPDSSITGVRLFRFEHPQRPRDPERCRGRQHQSGAERQHDRADHRERLMLVACGAPRDERQPEADGDKDDAGLDRHENAVAWPGRPALDCEDLHQPVAPLALKKLAEFLHRPEPLEHAVVEVGDQLDVLAALPAVDDDPDDKADHPEKAQKEDLVGHMLSCFHNAREDECVNSC